MAVGKIDNLQQMEIFSQKEVQCLKVWRNQAGVCKEIDLEAIEGSIVNIQASERSIGCITADKGHLFIVGENYIKKSEKNVPMLIEHFAEAKIKILHVAFGSSHCLAVG